MSFWLLALQPVHAAADLPLIGGSQWVGSLLLSFKQAQPVLAGVLSVAGLMLLSWIASKSLRSGRQRQPAGILERLPDAIALFDAKGRLTAINSKLLKLLPLETNADQLDSITTSDLYAQLSPDNIAIERARNDARNQVHDPDSTISFEVPSYGPKSLLVKETRY